MRTDFQKPYDWFDNVPDQNSEDFRNVMDWLKKKSVPEPSVSFIFLIPAPDGQRYPGPIMMLTFPGYATPMDATLVLNSPGMVPLMLGMTAAMPNYEPPAAPAAPVPLPPGQPANPIGVYLYTNRSGHKILTRSSTLTVSGSLRRRTGKKSRQTNR